jgi:uncharacterized protein YndB with AHSA1/START domain
MALTQYVIERTFSAPPAAVYRAFTDPSLFAKWVWGDFGKDVQAEIDLKINGLIEVTDTDGKQRRRLFRGIFLVIEPERKLIYTLHWDGDVGYNRGGNVPVDEVLVLDFLPHDDGCQLRYRHMGIPDDGVSAPEHERSVRVTLDHLEKVLAAG